MYFVGSFVVSSVFVLFDDGVFDDDLFDGVFGCWLFFWIVSKVYNCLKTNLFSIRTHIHCAHILTQVSTKKS